MGGRRTVGDRRGSQVQEPGTKTEAVICPGEQDRATPDQHSPHRPGIRERGTKGPKSRSSSLARVSASATPTPKYQDDSKFFTKKTRSEQHECDRPKGHKTDRFVIKSQHPPCPGIRSQKETEIDDPTYTLQPVANRTGTHRQRCVAPSGPGKPDRTHRL